MVRPQSVPGPPPVRRRSIAKPSTLCGLRTLDLGRTVDLGPRTSDILNGHQVELLVVQLLV